MPLARRRAGHGSTRCGTERQLAGVGVAAAAQQVEALRQPLDELLRAEELRARGRELQRQRKVVEPAAELGQRGRRSETRIERARALGEELLAVDVGERRAAGTRARRRSRSRSLLVTRSFSRGQLDSSSRARARHRAGARSCRPGSASDGRRCASRARRSCRALCATACRTRPESRSAASGTQKTPPGCSSASSARPAAQAVSCRCRRRPSRSRGAPSRLRGRAPRAPARGRGTASPAPADSCV